MLTKRQVCFITAGLGWHGSNPRCLSLYPKDSVKKEVSLIKGQCSSTDAELAALKVQLYAKFGDAINLEK
jgi:hypothetical protein